MEVNFTIQCGSQCDDWALDKVDIGRGSSLRLILIIYSAKKGPLLRTEARWTVALGVSLATTSIGGRSQHGHV